MIELIEPARAHALLEAGGAALLDVRTEEEYALGHIAGSLLLPVDDVEAGVEALLPDKARPVIVYCRSGRRSRMAVEVMEKLGYETLYDLGGVCGWPYGLEHLPE